MPYQVEIFKKHNLVVLQMSGVFTNAEAEVAFLDASSKSDFSPQMDQFIDFSKVESYQVTPEYLKGVAYIDQNRMAVLGKNKIAILAPDPLVFGMCRIWQSLASLPNTQVEVFKEKNPACQWLGVDSIPEASSAQG